MLPSRGWQCGVNSEGSSRLLCVPDSCHPECFLLQECQEMHGEFMGSACGHHGPYTPDVLFWSCILFFATFIVSSTLKTFKTSRYFPTRVGSMLMLCLCLVQLSVRILSLPHAGAGFSSTGQLLPQLCQVQGGGFKPLRFKGAR